MSNPTNIALPALTLAAPLPLDRLSAAGNLARLAGHVLSVTTARYDSRSEHAAAQRPVSCTCRSPGPTSERRPCPHGHGPGDNAMTAPDFDTLTAVREQAETAVRAMRDAASASRTDLATRADLYQVALGIVIASATITFGLTKRL